MLGAKRPACDMAPTVRVSVKWGKEAFSDVEVDLGESPLVFKSQLFALSGVPPARQKVMIKGALLKDEEWGKAAPKEGATVMLMGSAEAVPVEPPPNLPTFLEDLPEAAQQHLETRAYGAGLQNLGNTCYMNSVVQCMYAVQPLRKALVQLAPAQRDGPSPISKLVAAAQRLMTDLEAGGEPFPPFQFLLTLRQAYPQFAQQGREGGYAQQDAEECWTNIMYALRETVKDGAGKSIVEDMFGIGTTLKLKCEESEEELQEHATSYSLRCNIGASTNHLSEGIALGLRDDREKTSASLGRSCLWRGSSALTRLPPYLSVQLVRFFYKVDTQSKAKVLRKVTFQHELDVHEFCAPELKEALAGPRAAYKAVMDARIERDKAAKNDKAGGAKADAQGGAKGGAGDAGGSSGGAADGAGAGPAAGGEGSSGGDAAMEEAACSSGGSHVGAHTGKYELCGVLTHKGRSTDSGHYTAWTKQADGKWVLFDDDELHVKSAEDILALSGGGDWHMAYLLLYRAITVPSA